MRFLKLLSIITALVVVPSFAGAINFLTPNNNGTVIFEASQTSPDFIITGGSTVIFNGQAEDGALVAADELNILSNMSNHLFALANQINIKGSIDGNLIAIASQVVIDKDAIITGDLLLLGSASVVINGKIEGDVILKAATDLVVSGIIDGKLDLGRIDSVQINNNAEIHGDIKGSTKNSAIISPDAQINGENQITVLAKTNNAGFALGIIFQFLSILIFVTTLKIILPAFTFKTRDTAFAMPAQSILKGIFALIVVPIIATIFIVTPITTMLGVALLLSWFVLIIVGIVFASIWIGDALTGKRFSIYAAAAIGVLFNIIFGFVPILQIILGGLILMLGMGAVSSSLLSAKKTK